MSRSFAQMIALSCGNCGQRFMAEVWLIVDAAERPDLIDRIQDETIHSPRCTHCGTPHTLDAPLLFHDGRTHTLIFAAPEAATDAQQRDLARQLGQQLIASIPRDERQPYLATAQVVVGSAGLHTALRAMAEQTSDELSEALPALMAAESPGQVRAVAQQHPVVQTATAIEQLQTYIAQLRAQRHEALADALAQRVAVLTPATPATGQPSHPARQLIQALLDADSPAQRLALLRDQPQPISPELATMLAALAEQAERQQLDAVARDLLVIRAEVLAHLDQDRPATRPKEHRSTHDDGSPGPSNQDPR